MPFSISPALRRAAGAVLAASAALAVAPAAQAGVLVASAPSCEKQVLSQPFLPFLDPAHYTLVRGGTFEAGAAGWELQGAEIAKGNEPFYLTSRSDRRSLRIPGGTSVTTPVICVGLEHPTLRFVARNNGSLLAPLAVAVNFEDASGAVHTLAIGTVAGSGWAPTLPLPVVANLLPLLPGERTPVSFTFTTLPGTAGWQVDDVYVDPYSRN